MKAYFFNEENGLYQGEFFEDDNLIHFYDGITIKAPPKCDKHHVPVFVKSRQSWSLVPLPERKDPKNGGGDL